VADLTISANPKKEKSTLPVIFFSSGGCNIDLNGAIRSSSRIHQRLNRLVIVRCDVTWYAHRTLLRSVITGSIRGPRKILETKSQCDVVIVGAGPAGLTAGYELARNGHQIVVLEQDPQYVGGLARTIQYKGFRFDIGGHRFFSKNQEIESLWTEWMGERMRVRSRLSRIHYRGRFFKYPLEPFNALRELGPLETISCLLSYLRASRPAPEPVRSFEDWVVRAFGRRLYETFFRSYTEKVWGIPCAEISADWAAQRIRGLSLLSLMRSLIPGQARDGQVAKTLTDHFRYPRRGPGEVWERVAEIIESKGGEVRMGERVIAIEYKAGRITSITTESINSRRTYLADNLISTMPLAHLVSALDPAPPDSIIASASGLRYRAFIAVALILDQAEVFPDNWIYIHDPEVKVARIQNFKNWSAEMVPDQRLTMLGLEYFCSDRDALWSSSDEQLIALAKDEVAKLGLAESSKVIDGTVVRQAKAYPMYDHDYRAKVARVRAFLKPAAANLQVAGRNGMHKYDNQDHAMLTGLMAARNIMGGCFDPWRVNSDAEYLEEEEGNEDSNGRMQPGTIDSTREVRDLSTLDVTRCARDS
jgi:protoporphyrinogen oxidase